jgi:hypothetical protein
VVLAAELDRGGGPVPPSGAGATGSAGRWGVIVRDGQRHHAGPDEPEDTD